MIPIFRVTDIRKISRSGIRTHHTGQTSPTLRDGIGLVKIQEIIFQT